jgi:hypothetical protein
VKKREANHRSKSKHSAPKDAWAAAEAYGFDMKLLEERLRMTPEQRIDANQDALDLAEALEAAGRRQREERH